MQIPVCIRARLQACRTMAAFSSRRPVLSCGQGRRLIINQPNVTRLKPCP